MRAEEQETPAKDVSEVMPNELDDEHDTKECVLQRYFLLEWNRLKSLLDDIVINGRVSDPSAVNKIRSILEKYQEQGQLLEPYLESIVSPLMSIVRLKTIELGVISDEILDIIKPMCIIIYSLVTVCGYKAVIKFFPHQVSDLELAVSLLEKCHHETTTTSLRQESTGEMEAKCIILLWLSILVLVPFDISIVDTSIADSNFIGGTEPSPLVLTILGFAKDYLSNAGPMRSMAGLLLSKLLTRPDMPKAFNSFIEWTHEILSSFTDEAVDHFQLLGVVGALAAIFKVGGRKYLVDLVPIVWNDTSNLIKSKPATRSPLLRKFLAKLTQRIGLTCLPHRSPSWCYVGKNSSLGQNISEMVTDKRDGCGHGPNVNSWNSDQNASCMQDDDMDIPEIVEEIIEVLLSGLRDSDTVVRWSAAKGLGRVTACLTSALADEVLSSILELFSPVEGDGSWHGGCLALAELARRGLLVPSSLPKVVPFIIKALHYDIRRGPHSIGSHVRDAAAYVCWAFGRAYYHSDMKEILVQLAPHLLTVACYDREVNCRRAAAAAFQENVGRQGNYPHGIDIVNAADYFSLSSRANSYLNVASCIAQFEGYLYPFVEELLFNKICHWDRSLRELAAEALSVLVKYDPEYFATTVLERLIPCCLSTDLCMRHGATIAVGQLVLAVHQCDHVLSPDKQKAVAGIVPAIEKARLYRGKGGEIMRSAVSQFIRCISQSRVFLPEKTKRSLLDTLNENLRHPNAQIQNAAVEALKHFFPAYFVRIDDGSANGITSKYLELLSNPNAAARRGSSLALGILPFEFLAARWRDVLLRLCSSCAVEDNPDDRDAEARVNAVRGLVSVCETLSKTMKLSASLSPEDCRALYLFIKNEVMQALFKGLEDYCVDNRGDVGSWVREAAMDGLEKCTYILCERESVGFPTKVLGVENTVLLGSEIAGSDHGHLLFDASLATSLVGGLLKQAVEKIDKLREKAGKMLQRILFNEGVLVPCIPYREKLEQIVPNDMDVHWGVPNFSYPCFLQLLQFSCYSKFLISGLVISVGGLQESLRKASLSALLEYLQDTENYKGEGRTKDHMLASDLLWVLQHYRRRDRVIVPALKTIEILFSNKIFLRMEANAAEFFHGVLDSLAIELKGSKDFSKLYAGISILGYIAAFMGTVNSPAFRQLLIFLGHRYPKIRKAAADQVYLVLLQCGNLVAEDKMGKALDILSESCWDGDIEDAKYKRLQLYEIAGLETRVVMTRSEESNKDDYKRAASDENASYSSLVGSSGF